MERKGKAMLRSRDDRMNVWQSRDKRGQHHMPHRWCLLILLAVFGFVLLAHGAGAGTPGTTQAALFSPTVVHSQTGGVQAHAADAAAGMGAGNTSAGNTRTTGPTATCWDPLDVTCWLQNAAQWIAQQIMNALQPVVTMLLQSPLNILTQTPPADTYSNATVITWWTSFLGVANLALACLVVIGGYNVMVRRSLGLRHSELVEFLPRLLLAFGATSFSLYFLGLFIDLENALCAVALNLAGTAILTNIIQAIYQGNPVGEGLLVWVLAVVLGGMVILLGVQMPVRLALLWVLKDAAHGSHCRGWPARLPGRFAAHWLLGGSCQHARERYRFLLTGSLHHTRNTRTHTCCHRDQGRVSIASTNGNSTRLCATGWSRHTGGGLGAGDGGC